MKIKMTRADHGYTKERVYLSLSEGWEGELCDELAACFLTKGTAVVAPLEHKIETIEIKETEEIEEISKKTKRKKKE